MNNSKDFPTVVICVLIDTQDRWAAIERAQCLSKRLVYRQIQHEFSMGKDEYRFRVSAKDWHDDLTALIGPHKVEVEQYT